MRRELSREDLYWSVDELVSNSGQPRIVPTKDIQHSTSLTDDPLTSWSAALRWFDPAAGSRIPVRPVTAVPTAAGFKVRPVCHPDTGGVHPAAGRTVLPSFNPVIAGVRPAAGLEVLPFFDD